jgi:hypothetical protein
LKEKITNINISWKRGRKHKNARCKVIGKRTLLSTQRYAASAAPSCCVGTRRDITKRKSTTKPITYTMTDLK